MAPRLSGFTRASSLGPIDDYLHQRGVSVTRVLDQVGLPAALLEQRDIVIPLREQFRLLECAARQTGDAYLGASLGQSVRVADLSAFGPWICSAETLQQAIVRAQGSLSTMLQTSTDLKLERRGSVVRWTIEFREPESEGRRHNELLGVSYMIDMVRTFAGAGWRPAFVMTTQAAGAPRQKLEDIFGCNVSHGRRASGFEFDAALLGSWRQAGAQMKQHDDCIEPRVPTADDALEAISAVTELALYDGYPRIDWVCARLGVTRRTLQRHLQTRGTSFVHVAETVMLRKAKRLLADRSIPVTVVGLELGYRDPAHFTRAFSRWTGVVPSAYRAGIAAVE